MNQVIIGNPWIIAFWALYSAQQLMLPVPMRVATYMPRAVKQEP